MWNGWGSRKILKGLAAGIGMLTGGYIAEVSTFDKAYLFGACLTIVSMLYFNIKVTPHYHKNKLR